MKRITSHTTPSLVRSLMVLAMVIGTGAFLPALQPAQAATTIFTVNTNADTNNGACTVSLCTLRDAIDAANSNAGPDVIDFSVTGTITLTSPLPDITDDVTINGPGPNQLTVSGAGSFRVFKVTATGVVTFKFLNISGGNVLDWGGGILNSNTGTVNINYCTVSGNFAGYDGGGISNIYIGTVNVANTTLSGNAANYGAGIGGGGYLNVTNSTLAGNSASSDGGAIYAHPFWYAGSLTVTNSTLTGNSAAVVGGITYRDTYPFGGNPATVTNSTVSGNFGVGVDAGFITPVNLKSSIVALNTGPDLSQSIDSQGYNVIGTNSSYVIPAPTDQFGVTAAQLKLGPLQNNGGPTKTMALDCASVAMDKGINSNALGTDQRDAGFARTFDDPIKTNAAVGDGTDVGAVEGQTACAYRPANIRDCMNNGWEAFTNPSFRNQGDCIQFVNTAR